jgi:hypothetical protein
MLMLGHLLDVVDGLIRRLIVRGRCRLDLRPSDVPLIPVLVLGNPATAICAHVKGPRDAVSLGRRKSERQFERCHRLPSFAHYLKAPTSQRITRTMMITPMIPMPPFLFISISRSVSHSGHSVDRAWSGRRLAAAHWRHELSGRESEGA